MLNQQATRINVYRIVIVFVAGCLVGCPNSVKAEETQPSNGAVTERKQSNESAVQTNRRDAKKPSIFANIDPVLTRDVMGRARKHKTNRDWKKYDAEMNRLSEAAPKNIGVWLFRAWDLGFNWAQEIQDREIQWRLLCRALEVLLEGLKHNPNRPELYADVGWNLGVLIEGRFDEGLARRVASDAALLKRLSQHVDPTAVVGPEGEVEPHLLSVEYYKIATRQLEACGMQCEQSPIVLMAQPANAYVRYAHSLHRRGHFGEHTQWVWTQAANAWEAYGDVRLPTASGTRVRLNDLDVLEDRRDKIRTELGQIIALGTVARTAQTQEIANAIRHLPEEKQQHAKKLLREWKEASDAAKFVSRFRAIMNYSPEIARCKLERHPDAVSARRSLWRAKQRSLSKTERERLYSKAFEQFAQLIEAHPAVIEEPKFCYDLFGEITKYQRHILDGNELPSDFPLKNIVETSRVP